MYFRSKKKSQNEVSLSDSIDTDQDGNSLYLMDIVGVDDTMYADLQDKEDCIRIRKLVRECLTPREEEIVSLRYGLGGQMPRTQREIAAKLGISRSYVSQRSSRTRWAGSGDSEDGVPSHRIAGVVERNVRREGDQQQGGGLVVIRNAERCP